MCSSTVWWATASALLVWVSVYGTPTASHALKQSTVRQICKTGSTLEAGIRYGIGQVKEAERRAEESGLLERRLFLASLLEMPNDLKDKIIILHYYATAKATAFRGHLKTITLKESEAGPRAAYAKGRIDEFLAVFAAAKPANNGGGGCLLADEIGSSVATDLSKVDSQCKTGLNLEQITSKETLDLGAKGFTGQAAVAHGTAGAGGSAYCQLTKVAKDGGYVGNSAAGNAPTSVKWADGLVVVDTNGGQTTAAEDLTTGGQETALPSLTAAYKALKKLHGEGKAPPPSGELLNYETLTSDADFRKAFRLAKKLPDEGADDRFEAELRKTFGIDQATLEKDVINRVYSLPVKVREGDKQVLKRLEDLTTADEMAAATLLAQFDGPHKPRESPPPSETDTRVDKKVEGKTEEKIIIKSETSAAKLRKHSFTLIVLALL